MAPFVAYCRFSDNKLLTFSAVSSGPRKTTSELGFGVDLIWPQVEVASRESVRIASLGVTVGY